MFVGIDVLCMFVCLCTPLFSYVCECVSVYVCMTVC